MNNARKDFFAKILLLIGVISLAFLVNFNFHNTSSIPAIDVHEHIVLKSTDTTQLVSIMNDLNIQKMVLLDTPGITFGTSNNFTDYDKNIEIQLAMKRQYPGRFLVLYSYPPWDADGPNKIEKYSREGIDGLKFYNGVIYDLLGPINSTAMYHAYEKARELNISVLIHVESQDPDQLPQFEQVLHDFPDVTFICPHMCAAQDHLDILEKLLDEHPNLYTDVSAWQRVGSFAVNNSESFRSFIIKHQDRVMYASDIVKGDEVNPQLTAPYIEKWFKCEKDLLEKTNFVCFLEGNRVLQGLHLPDSVLKNIYQVNPKKVYKNA